MTDNNSTPSSLQAPGRRNTRYLTEPAMQAILISSALVGIIIYFIKISQTILINNWTFTAIYSVIFLGILGSAFIRPISIRVRYISYLVLILALGIVDLFLGGINSDGLLYLLLFSVLSALFFSIRIGLLTAFLSIIAFIFIAFGMITRIFTPNDQFGVLISSSTFDWVLIGLGLLFGIAASFAGIYQLIPNLVNALFVQEDKSFSLNNDNQFLAKSVDEASINLQRKTAELAVASQIARSIALQEDPLSMIDNTLNSIRDQFGFYHAGLFLLDPRREFAVLNAATGDAGREMLSQNHRLRIGEQGIVGFVAAQGIARIAADVGQDSVHFQNPLLPNTHSEMALPLRLGDRVIGVLDVQSEHESAFTQQDVNIIQTIADQLAISIDHARVVAELQNNLEEYRSRTQMITQKDWANFLLGLHSSRSIRFTPKGIQKSTNESALTREAFSSGETQVRKRKSRAIELTTIAIPIRLRDASIGVIEVKVDNPQEVENIQSLIESSASRLALSLENARLIEEMQIRMEQEKMVSEITSKVRSSTAINDILRQTAIELGKSMGVSDVRVELRTKSAAQEQVETVETQG
jgi:putative methionine-R-sulfoxide reductase with GAF domain